MLTHNGCGSVCLYAIWRGLKIAGEEETFTIKNLHSLLICQSTRVASGRIVEQVPTALQLSAYDPRMYIFAQWTDSLIGQASLDRIKTAYY